jgi:hypothetical protein
MRNEVAIARSITVMAVLGVIAAPLIDERFAAIKQGFDRIRGREPRR